MKIAFENGVFVSSFPSAVPSVVKKDTTPTDAPKGTWPFSVDSDSSWRQLRAARGALLLETTLGHPWERAFNCLMPALVQLWLELAGRHAGFILLRGHVCQFPYHFAVIFF